MAIGSIGAYSPAQYVPQQQSTPPVQQARGTDGDTDTGSESSESSAVQSRESASSAPPLPTDPNRGRNLNISV